MTRWATAAGALALALLTYFQFPGHTYLQQDSQIYLPILENLRDPSVLRNDILAQHPHVAFTLYDEAARALRAISGTDFRTVLTVEQIATRAVGIWGLYLMALAIGFPVIPAASIAAICSLGVSVSGPAVLTWEYEPTPRAFAVPLLLGAMGLAAHRRFLVAGVAGALAFLYHPPTAVPFWAVFVVLLVYRKEWRGLWPLLIAGVVLALAAVAQTGESQSLFSRLTPSQEALQRMRAPYVWISEWRPGLIPHYLVLSAVLSLAWLRLRREVPAELQWLMLGLPLTGMLSLPISWLLLEHWKWALIPQLQPLRALLFVTLGMQFLTATAGFHALRVRRYAEAFGWMLLAFLLPLHPVLLDAFPWRSVCLVVTLAALAVGWGGQSWPQTTFQAAGPAEKRVRGQDCPPHYPIATFAVVIAAFFAIPILGGIVNYPKLHTPELAQLAAWARNSTPADAVFLFPDAGHALDPGIFRAESLRSVYVDWKGGGQVNYLSDFADQWWFRWQQTMAGGFHVSDMQKYGGLGVQFVALRRANRLPAAPLFENAAYVVYAAR